MAPSVEDLLNQAKRFVALHTEELSNWKKRVEELTAEVEKAAKEAVKSDKDEEKPKKRAAKKTTKKSDK